MSAGYATKLSYRDDLGGQLGDSELSESSEAIEQKVAKLSAWVAASRNVVAFTGAGISTACGIPDFRGPSGIWTLQRAGRPIPEFKVSFAIAKPSLTHQALLALLQAGKFQYVVSQNVDGLHLRSGIPRSQLAELHGNCFAERCPKCKTEYIRDFEMETVGFKFTKRRCTKEGCKGRLKDHVLDWEDALPEDELNASEQAASEADLAICLGTSLQITPACDIPLKTLKAGGKLVIINLQKTPKDRKADLVIHAKCDDIMQQIMTRLELPIPPYKRQDSVVVSHTIKPAKARNSDLVRCSLSVQSVHGPLCALPLVKEVEIAFEMFLVSPVQDRTNGSHALSDFLLPLLWQGSSLGASFVPSTMSKDFDSTFSSMQVALQGCNRTAVKLQKQPFSVARSFQSSASVIASITLSLTPGLDVTQHTIRHAITSIASSSNETHSHIYHFSTQEQQYVLHTSREERAAPVAEDDSSSDSIVAKAPSAKRLKTS